MFEFPYGKLSHKRLERLLRTGKLVYRFHNRKVRVRRCYLFELGSGRRGYCSPSIFNDPKKALSLYEHFISVFKYDYAESTKKGQGGANPVHGSFADEQEEDTA